MKIIDNLLREFEPIDSREKIDSLIAKLNANLIKIDHSLDLKIRLKISSQRVLRYYLAKYFGETTGEKVNSQYHHKQPKYRKVYYGCSAQDKLERERKEDRRKRLATTEEEWRKVKHKLPVTVFDENQNVKYTEKAKIIFTPMGNKR